MELEDTIRCELCGKICKMQVSRLHLEIVHNMTTKQYRALGYKTLSPARMEQLRSTPVGQGTCPPRYGPAHPNWKGGCITDAGYKVIRRDGKLLFEHRVIAEQMLGRHLEPGEVVHHKDGNRANNSPDNLQVMTASEHAKLTSDTHWAGHTTPATQEAARLLISLGWSHRKVLRALRIQRATLKRWLDITD